MKNRNGMRSTACSVLVLMWGLLDHQARAAEPHEDFICTYRGETRVVSLFNGEAGAATRAAASGCRVDYTKGGATRTLWSSKSSHAYCAAKAAALVTTLEQGRFSCKAKTLERADEP